MSNYKQLGEKLRSLPKAELAKLLSQLTEEEANEILYDSWRDVWSRPNQRFEDHWPESITLVLAGRGWGKTKSACEWIKEQVASGEKLVTICAPTSSDLRDTITEGPSGILSCYYEKDPSRPTYVPSKSRIEWPNGAVARLISAENPERGRGLNTGILWMDEVGSMNDIDIYHQLMFGLRSGKSKALITTTPRACAIVIDLHKRIGKDVRLVNGSTFENKDNLSDTFINTITSAYEGTSMGSQELHGKLILTNPGAMWQQKTILDNTIEEETLPNIVAYAIGIDPAVSVGKKSDKTGISVVGLGEDGLLYILGDYTGKYSSQGWAQKVTSLYDQYSQVGPVTIIVERNNGGDMCADALYRERPNLPVKTIFSSSSKLARAQPIALLAEQGKVKHVRGAGLQDLEAEMISFDGRGKQKSPDYLDAFVFAATHLAPLKKNFVAARDFLI